MDILTSKAGPDSTVNFGTFKGGRNSNLLFVGMHFLTHQTDPPADGVRPNHTAGSFCKISLPLSKAVRVLDALMLPRVHQGSSRIRKSSALLPSTLPLLWVSSHMQDSDDRNVVGGYNKVNGIRKPAHLGFNHGELLGIFGDTVD